MIAIPKLLLLLSFILITFSFDPCAPIEYDDYTFDISTLPDETIPINGSSKLANVYTCKPSSCKTNGYNTSEVFANQEAYVQYVGEQCIPYSSIPTLIQSTQPYFKISSIFRALLNQDSLSTTFLSFSNKVELIPITFHIKTQPSTQLLSIFTVILKPCSKIAAV